MSTSTRACNIAIADDHPIVWDGLHLLTARDNTLKIIFTAKDGTELLRNSKLKKCDILILDLTMPRMDGFKVIEKLKKEFPTVHILIFTMHNNQEFFGKCMGMGVKGYVLKRDPPETLLNAIKNIMAGKMGISPSISPMLIDESPTEEKVDNGFKELTEREVEVFSLVASGLTSKEIAQSLNIKKPTVDKHRENIRIKLGTNNIAQLIEVARKNNII